MLTDANTEACLAISTTGSLNLGRVLESLNYDENTGRGNQSWPVFFCDFGFSC